MRRRHAAGTPDTAVDLMTRRSGMTLSSIVRRVVALGTGAFAGVVLMAAAPRTEEPIASRAQLATLLARVASEACPLQCQWDCLDDDKHSTEEHVNGTNGGTNHSCEFTEKGCQDHSCSEMLAQTDLAQVEVMLRSMSVDDLLAVAEEQPRLALNEQRNAIQLEGCGGRMLLSIGLSPEQAAQRRR
jgi:hypothetical protein